MNTDTYLILGLIVTVVILGGYTASLWLRFRQAGNAVQTLEMLAEDES